MNKDTEGFVVVKEIQPTTSIGLSLPTVAGETVSVRDFNGLLVDALSIDADGHFTGRYGRVRRDQLGEYVVRLTNRPGAVSHLE